MIRRKGDAGRATSERVGVRELSKQQPSTPRITAAAFQELAWQGVPFVAQLGWRIERFAAGDIAVRLPYSELLLRPGGTICGPALMALADVTLYGLVLSMIGRVELAVTTNLNVHFLSRPGAQGRDRRGPDAEAGPAPCGRRGHHALRRRSAADLPRHGHLRHPAGRGLSVGVNA